MLVHAVAAATFPPVKIYGLPLHPLVVHAVVVLLPLSALGGIVMALWPKFSKRFGPVIVLTAYAGVAGALAASHTGEQLMIALSKGVGSHQTMGENLKYIAAAFALLLSILYYLDWRIGRPGKPKKRTTLDWVVAVGTIIVAILSIYWVIAVGHSGASLVWKSIGLKIHG
jgi:uncharacterized membrane protein